MLPNLRTSLLSDEFFLCVELDEERNRRTKVYTRDESVARILEAANRIKAREVQLRPTTRDFRTRVAKCGEVDREVLEHLL
jgi:hypothetical protein